MFNVCGCYRLTVSLARAEVRLAVFGSELKLGAFSVRMSVLPLREFISGRLTAAAEEIFGVFERTIAQYQTEIDRQRRLLESGWKPNLHRTDLLRQYLSKREEIPADQQLFTTAGCSHLNQDPPEPPRIKEEHEEAETSQVKEEPEELCRTQHDEQLVLDRDSDVSMMPLTYEQRVQSEPEPNRERILSHVFSEVESGGHDRNRQEDFESTRRELKPKERHLRNRSQSNNVDNSFTSQSHFEAETSNTLMKCDAGEEAFNSYAELKKHFRIHMDLPQDYVSKEEENSADQQLSNQQGSSSLDQKQPEPPQIKDEQGEPKPSQIKEEHEEHLVLKEEIDTFTVTSAYEESDDSEPEPTTKQLLLQNYLEAGSQDQQGNWHEDFGSPSTAEPMPKMTPHKNTSYTAVGQGQRNTGDGSLESQFCGKVCENNVDMKEHYKLHTGEKSLSCSVCGKVFKYNVNLLVHMRTHTGEKPYPCEICGKCFSQKVNLNVHMRTHTGEKPYLCKTCGKRFSDSSGFKRHTTIHTGEKPYVCKTCNKTFRYNVNLLVHMRTHTDERPYFCKTCGRTFSDPSTLRKHIITHTGAKSYSCQICGKCFTDNSNLLRHMRTHTGEKPYSCDVCRKSFSQSSNLMQHIRTHTGEKPYPCGICDKSYSHSCTLLKHMRSHTGEKPFSCETCGRCFSHKCTLLKHMKIHTDKIPS